MMLASIAECGGSVILWRDARQEDAARLGGKGCNLVLLRGAGQPVPPWFCVTSDAFRAAVDAAGAREALDAMLRDLPAGQDQAIGARARAIQDRVRTIPIPPPVRSAVEDAYARVADGDGLVAVRSSVLDEDAAGGSFAGLHDSFLFVRGLDDLIENIRKVWVSAFNERAFAYRVSQGLVGRDVAVAVIVQRMVEARVSGVLFTANPTTRDVQEMVISTVYGAGEGLVSAGFDADAWTVRKDGGATVSTVADKTEMLVLDAARGQGLVQQPVPEPERHHPSLTDEQVQEVARAGLAIEQACRRPQDIEFAFDAEGGLFILQTRPVTTVDEDGPAAGHHLIWDNSNIIESYSGVTSPMTFSFIRRAYTIVYHCFAEVMGIPPRVVKENQETFENMLGLIRGEVYYNLLNWYRLVRMFPGFEYNKAFMESMMGVRQPAELADSSPPLSFRRRYFVELPALAGLVTRSTWNFARIRGITARFQQHFETHYRRWDAMDFDALSPPELMQVYRDMEDRLLRQWKAPIINDFFVMIFYGALRKLCQTWCEDQDGSLQNELLCGEGGIESTQPTRRLMKLAQSAREDEALCRLIREEEPDAVVAKVREDPRFQSFSHEIEDYLDRYGFRCMNELKLEEPSLRDRPGFVYQILRNYVREEDPSRLDVDALETRERELRAAAERRAHDRLSASRWGRLRRPLFRFVLRRARLGVKNRENMRFARTRIYGLLRELINALGRRFADEGLLDTERDIYYLTLDEVWDYIKGTAVTTRLRDLAALRTAEFDTYRTERDRAPADRFDTFGMVYHRNRYQPVTSADQATEPGHLRGVPCCPGQVTGPVKVILSPSDDIALNGEILVAARTDPGWVPLYPSVSGLLIERGSVLSHSAIVAREMGIPAIVGIAGLTETLQSGQQVRMDGAAGTVEVLGATDEG